MAGIFGRTGMAIVALALTACGGGDSNAPGSGQADSAAGGAEPATAAAPPAADGLIVPASWMPADWDRDVYPGSGEPLDPQAVRKFRQSMLNTVPFTLWAVSNDTLVTEAFEPIWVWYTAIRSCQNGIQMTEDLAGEFGNRERGKAALAKARADLKAWAATQPADMTLYFTATLGQWNEATGAFPLQQPSNATTLPPQDIEQDDPYFDGARVELWSDASGQSINHFQASLTAPQCVSADKTKVYKFERMSQWWVVFGDVDRGMGGLADYKSHTMLPPVQMSREAAATLAGRNPQRKVVVAVTFAPVGSSFVKGTDQSAIRAKFRKVSVTDALDGSVLAAKSY